MKRVLITGSLGQLGTELGKRLRSIHGVNNVIMTDVRNDYNQETIQSGPFQTLDVLESKKIANIVEKNKINIIYHLAALLSGDCEKRPEIAWNLNINGTKNVLEVAKQYKCQVFTPSSIGAFGLYYDKNNVPQNAILRPVSVYGITKVTGELMCDYYFHKHGVDTRGLRYPGIISTFVSGGGTTDYAIQMMDEVIRHGKYTCYLKGDTSLDMMFIPDSIDAAIQLMDADPSKLRHRNAFNVTAMHFTPEILAAEIRKYYPNFKLDYKIDPVRQAIADSWPNYMNDDEARRQWGWNPKFGFEVMVREILKEFKEKIAKEKN